MFLNKKYSGRTIQVYPIMNGEIVAGCFSKPTKLDKKHTQITFEGMAGPDCGRVAYTFCGVDQTGNRQL